MRMHTNEQAMGKGAVLSCDVCGAEVGTNERLLRHVEREHAYQCPVRNEMSTDCSIKFKLLFVHPCELLINITSSGVRSTFCQDGRSLLAPSEHPRDGGIDCR